MRKEHEQLLAARRAVARSCRHVLTLKVKPSSTSTQATSQSFGITSCSFGPDDSPLARTRPHTDRPAPAMPSLGPAVSPTKCCVSCDYLLHPPSRSNPVPTSYEQPPTRHFDAAAPVLTCLLPWLSPCWRHRCHRRHQLALRVLLRCAQARLVARQCRSASADRQVGAGAWGSTHHAHAALE